MIWMNGVWGFVCAILSVWCVKQWYFVSAHGQSVNCWPSSPWAPWPAASAAHASGLRKFLGWVRARCMTWPGLCEKCRFITFGIDRPRESRESSQLGYSKVKRSRYYNKIVNLHEAHARTHTHTHTYTYTLTQTHTLTHLHTHTHTHVHTPSLSSQRDMARWIGASCWWPSSFAKLIASLIAWPLFAVTFLGSCEHFEMHQIHSVQTLRP